MAHARFAPGIIFRRIGGTTSSRSIRVTGSAIGIAAAITFGADIIAGLSTAPGSSSTSDFIRGGPIGIRMTTMLTITTVIRTVTTRAITIQALTRVKSITVRTATVKSTVTQLLPRRRSDSRGKVIIAGKSTALTAQKHGEPSRDIKATTVCV